MYLFAISIKSNYFCTNPKIKPMKRIITFVLSVFAIGAMAQPIIDGKYLPARETSVNMVYDAVSVFTAPTIGINQNWDYTWIFRANRPLFSAVKRPLILNCIF
jgi:glycerol uptake facilitator-like aquaporin